MASVSAALPARLPAVFEPGGGNGRALDDDSFDIAVQFLAGSRLGNASSPRPATAGFPYLSPPQPAELPALASSPPAPGKRPWPASLASAPASQTTSPLTRPSKSRSTPTSSGSPGASSGRKTLGIVRHREAGKVAVAVSGAGQGRSGQDAPMRCHAVPLPVPHSPVPEASAQ